MIFDHDNDPLAAVKGILLGVALGALFWLAAGIMVWFLK